MIITALQSINQCTITSTTRYVTFLQ